MNIASGTPKVGTIGCQFVIDWGEDLSLATVKKLTFQKPDGSTFSKNAIVADNNYLTWTTTAAADLDMAGAWSVVAYIESPSYTGYGETLYFTVDGIF